MTAMNKNRINDGLCVEQYTVSQKKNKQNYFCYNYVKISPNLIIF